ncbi:hypothetical protein HanXRQr2_Chr07g0285231 [Helianthus annuus]|uniref:Uncharacterized protein n=1 Tax=Helianthus annuus TaxID=4232 RepID=A0A251TTZ3_HELAN|nr:hypothetical protein HanXRQr2_Chr07g0285231 [Helianthus annuus]KAJ0903962.1 hypothetical protein HanPSC8_Chr07g0276151 [Helianthus annuus]
MLDLPKLQPPNQPLNTDPHSFPKPHPPFATRNLHRRSDTITLTPSVSTQDHLTSVPFPVRRRSSPSSPEKTTAHIRSRHRRRVILLCTSSWEIPDS